MSIRNALKNRNWSIYAIYEQFEQIVSRSLLFLISVIIVYSLVLAAIAMIADLRTGVDFEPGALQDTFGLIFTVVILLEFNHSLATAMRTRSGIIQVRTIVLIAIIVIARKVILLDYKTATLETLLGLGGLALCLGGLYWLIADGEPRRRSGNPPAQ
jgi:uncharacterized membrane protein (DUF373 family)